MTGARQEFDRVFGLYFKNVYAYFSLCFSPDTAEDCTQQVFLNVWRALAAPSARKPDNWKAWIFRLAVNVKNDFLRKKYTMPRMDALEEESLREYAEPDMARQVAVEQSFSQLTVAERELLLLKSNGFTSAEIGELLNLSASTVRSRLSAARGRLKKYLAENGVIVDE